MERSNFIEVHTIGQEPGATPRRNFIRTDLIDSVNPADDRHALIGGASWITSPNGSWLVTESQDEVLKKICALEGVKIL
jgi:hypothetical protein